MAFISNLSAPSLFWTVNSILVFIVCALSAGVLIPLILLISFCRNLFDMPDERKIHQGVVPRLGGIAFKSVVFFSVALLLVCAVLSYGNMLDSCEYMVDPENKSNQQETIVF